MLGSIDPTEKKVTIVGAGISGLLIGYFLKKRGFEVKILEASSRSGGLIESKKTEFGIAETAAHSLLVTPAVQELFNDLNLELSSVNEKSKARFIYRNQKMRRMPLRFTELISTLFRFFSKPKSAFDPSTGTLADWCEAYLGQPALRYLLSPFITGVYAASPHELNARLTFPKLIPSDPSLSLFQHLRSNRKSKKPRAKMMAPKGGMETLVKALEKELHSDIQFNSPIEELPKVTNLVLTVPSAELSKLIAKEDPESAQKLLQLRYSPLVTATCFYPASGFKKSPPRGVGVLIPRGEGLRILGVLFNSSAFEERAKSNQVSLTVMLGGTDDPEAIHLEDNEIQAIIQSELQKLLEVNSNPSQIMITHWKRAIPLYSNDLKSARESLFSGFASRPGRIVFSNFSDEVSIRGMIEVLSQL